MPASRQYFQANDILNDGFALRFVARLGQQYNTDRQNRMSTETEAELREWLQNADAPMRASLLMRHALRVLPAVIPIVAGMEEAGAQARLPRDILLAFLRSCLSNCVASKFPNEDLSEIIRSTESRANMFLEDIGRYDFRLSRLKHKKQPLYPSYTAASYASGLSSTGQKDWPSPERISKFLVRFAETNTHYNSLPILATLHDLNALGDAANPADIFEFVLWPERRFPEEIADHLEQLEQFFQNQPEEWNFWRRWFDGFLSGKPLDWELQLGVAKIHEDDWLEGPAAVASKMRLLEGNFQTSVARPLTLNAKTQRFEISDEEALPENVVKFVCKRITMALENALATAGGNGLSENSYETVTIRSGLDHHENDPSSLATAFYDASLSLNERIGDLYANDPSLTNLKNALYAAVEEICEQSTDAQKRCARLASLSVSKAADSNKQPDVAELAEIVAQEANEEAAVVLRADARIIASGGVVPKWVRVRFTNYTSTIVIWLDRTKKGHARLRWLIETVEELFNWLKSVGKE